MTSARILAVIAVLIILTAVASIVLLILADGSWGLHGISIMLGIGIVASGLLLLVSAYRIRDK